MRPNHLVGYGSAPFRPGIRNANALQSPKPYTKYRYEIHRRRAHLRLYKQGHFLAFCTRFFNTHLTPTNTPHIQRWTANK